MPNFQTAITDKLLVQLLEAKEFIFTFKKQATSKHVSNCLTIIITRPLQIDEVQSETIWCLLAILFIT